MESNREFSGADVDYISEAIAQGPGSEKFDVVRKILALAKVLGEDVASAEAAARQSDSALFAKSVEHKVGAGVMVSDEAAETIVDRNASGFVSVARNVVAEAVEMGCETVGVAIGAMLGSPTVGYAIGSAVGNFLNAPVGELVARGAPKVVSYARQAWQTTKRVVGEFVGKVTDWLFS